jgi:hypothetical protein
LENTRQYNVLIIFLGVDLSHYPLNSRNAFLRLFAIMKQNGYNDRMKWYKLTGIGASRDVEFRSIKHLSNFFLSFLSKAMRNGFNIKMYMYGSTCQHDNRLKKKKKKKQAR